MTEARLRQLAKAWLAGCEQSGEVLANYWRERLRLLWLRRYGRTWIDDAVQAGLAAMFEQLHEADCEDNLGGQMWGFAWWGACHWHRDYVRRYNREERVVHWGRDHVRQSARLAVAWDNELLDKCVDHNAEAEFSRVEARVTTEQLFAMYPKMTHQPTTRMREMDALRCAAAGMSGEESAAAMGVSGTRRVSHYLSQGIRRLQEMMSKELA